MWCIVLSTFSIPANFFWVKAWDFYPGSAGIFEDNTIISEDSRRSPKSSEEVRSLPKTSEVCRRRSYRENAYPQNQRLRGRYCHLFILHMVLVPYGSELTYFSKLCQARRQQLIFFNQAWEIGPQAWAGMRSKFSTRRRESWQGYFSTTGAHWFHWKTYINKASYRNTYSSWNKFIMPWSNSPSSS